MKATEVKLGKKTYVIMPKAEYLKLRKGEVPANTVDAVEYARASIGRDLHAARDHAGLTQEELAGKLGKSQTMIARAEAGTVTVGEKYVASVLAVCGLPEDWRPTMKISVEFSGRKGTVDVEFKKAAGIAYVNVPKFSTKIFPQHFDPPTRSSTTLEVLEQIKRDPHVQAYFGVKP